MRSASVTRPVARSLVRLINQHGFRYILWRGYAWSKTILHCCVRLFEESSHADDVGMAADLWFALGDLFDWTRAPRASAMAYERSAKLAPDWWVPKYEAAVMWAFLREYRRCQACAQVAIELGAPECRDVQQRVLFDLKQMLDLRWLRSEFGGTVTGADRCSERTIEVFERLARRQGRVAWKLARNMRLSSAATSGDTPPWLIKFLVTEASRSTKSSSYGKVVQHLPNSRELDSCFFFFLSAAGWESRMLWESAVRHARRIRALYVADVMDEDGRFGPPELFRLDEAYDPSEKACHRRVRVVAGFHLARVVENTKRLQSYASEFPQWKAATATLAYLQEYGRSPTNHELFVSMVPQLFPDCV